MSLLKRHSAFLVVLAAFTVLAVRFVWQAGIATIGDDSVSYLTLARVFDGGAGALQLREWAGLNGQFPPMFPGLLALVGGADDFRIGFLSVALFAALSLAFVYAFAAREFRQDVAGLWVVSIFVLLPTAWITLKGILSESMYLFMTMLVLVYHQELEERRTRLDEAVFLGVFIGAICLTRVVGITLFLAYMLHVMVGAIGRKTRPGWRELCVLAPPVAMCALWVWLRPGAGAASGYGGALGEVVRVWLQEPFAIALVGFKAMFAAWIASFNADWDSPLAPKIVFAILGLTALCGTIMRLRLNRLDAWYVTLYLAVIFLWMSPQEDRRFLYPVVPLLIVHAAYALVTAFGRLPLRRYRTMVLGVASAFVVLLAAPALLLIAEKSADRAPLVRGSHYSNAEIREYYETVNLSSAKAVAAGEIAVLAGLEMLAQVTPPDARIMWMRPDYVALLGNRAGVASYFSWDARRLVAAIAESNVDYFIVANVHKADFNGTMGDPEQQVEVVKAFSKPVFGLGHDFVLLKIDRQLLEQQDVNEAARGK